MEIYEEKKLKDGNILQIFQDSWAENPREDRDNLGTMLIFHRRYSFGDNTHLSSDDFNGWSEIYKYIIEKEKAAICIPIYMYDHSGITIKTTPFSCPWDSGQVGFIYVTKEKIRDWYNISRVKEEDLDKAKAALEHEVKIMDDFITGNVYGYQIINRRLEDGNLIEDIVDSCSGFYGTDFHANGMIDYVGKDLLIDTL